MSASSESVSAQPDVAADTWASIVYPMLQNVASGRWGPKVQAELLRWCQAFTDSDPQPTSGRAPRKKSSVFVQLEPAGSTVTEPTRLQDISESGVLLLLPRDANLALSAVLEAHVLIKADTEQGPKLLRLPARLVRVAGFDERHARVAFTFTEISAENALLLKKLKNLFYR